MNWKGITSIIISLTVIFSFQLFSKDKEISEFPALKNGMKFFVMERHTLPLVSLVIAVNVGSKDEDDSTRGFTHLLEHLILFRSTDSKSGEEIGYRMRKHGAYFNAHTGRDFTTFEISLPSEYLDFALEIYKEMLFNLKITEEGLSEEKKVILEEINSYYDDPEKYGQKVMYEQLFKEHPYAHPIYGTKQNIERATIEEIYSFYKKYFTPSNCALCVIGDIDKDYAYKKIKEIFGDLPSEEVIHPKITSSPPIPKTVKSVIQREVEQAYLIFGMIAPPQEAPDEVPARILTKIIGSGSNPRLWRALQRRGSLIHNLKVTYIPYEYSGVITVTVTLPSKNIKTAERIIRKTLKETESSKYSKNEYISREASSLVIDELKSAKNQLKIEQYSGFEIGLNVAMAIAKFLILREESTKISYFNRIEKVTSTDLRKFASKYFYQDRYSIVIITPNNEKK